MILGLGKDRLQIIRGPHQHRTGAIQKHERNNLDPVNSSVYLAPYTELKENHDFGDS